MIDFLRIATRTGKHGVIEVYPNFIITKSKDLMIRGSDFYAIWLEERGLWSTEEQDALQLIDRELDIYANEHKQFLGDNVRVLHMWDAQSGMIDIWHKYCQRQMRDNYHTLDETLIFANTSVKKDSYASKRLPYPLEQGSIAAYDELMTTLYTPEEREKIEWAIGSIVNGDSKKIQKFLVLYQGRYLCSSGHDRLLVGWLQDRCEVQREGCFRPGEGAGHGDRKALRWQQGQLLQGDPELGREEREEVSREDCYAEESCP